MSDYFADLDKIKAAGLEHGAAHISNGRTEPERSLFSGEWADGLMGQDALDYAGIDARFGSLDDFEQTDVMDFFEDGYNQAAWPGGTE